MNIDPKIQKLITSNRFIDIKLHIDEICRSKFQKWVNELIIENDNVKLLKAFYRNDFEELLRLAKDNDHNANFLVSICYYNGYLTLQNIPESYKHIVRAMELGNLSAKGHLALFYALGIQVPKNTSYAISLCNDLIDAKSILGVNSYLEVLNTLNLNDYSQFISFRNKAYARLIKAGNNNGLVHLAQAMILDHLEIKENTAEFSCIESLLTRAHYLKIPQATAILGSLYLNNQRIELGQKYIIEAALQGNHLAISFALLYPEIFSQIQDKLYIILLNYLANYNYSEISKKGITLNETTGPRLVEVVQGNLYEYSMYPGFRDALALIGIMIGEKEKNNANLCQDKPSIPQGEA